MGQQRSVQVHRLLSDEGTDPHVLELLAEKTQIFDDYARESAAKDLNLKAMQTQEIAIGTPVVAEKRERLEGGNGSQMTEPPVLQSSVTVAA